MAPYAPLSALPVTEAARRADGPAARKRLRVLSEFVIHAAIRLFQRIGVERPIVGGLPSLRVAQNLAIFLLAARYYRLLGIGDRRVLLANLSRLNSWARLVVTGGLFPLFAALAYRSWPPLLRGLALVILPAWTLAHLLGGVFAFGEPRES